MYIIKYSFAGNLDHYFFSRHMLFMFLVKNAFLIYFPLNSKKSIQIDSAQKSP